MSTPKKEPISLRLSSGSDLQGLDRTCFFTEKKQKKSKKTQKNTKKTEKIEKLCFSLFFYFQQPIDAQLIMCDNNNLFFFEHTCHKQASV